MTGDVYSVINSCRRNGFYYLFLINSTNFLNIFKIPDPVNNPEISELIASILIKTSAIRHMALSEDCDFAYLGGVGLFIINISNFDELILENTIDLRLEIIWVGVSSDKQRLYLDCGKYFYILNIGNLTNPFMVSANSKVASTSDRENLIYKKEGMNFIYLAYGDFFVESTYYYFKIHQEKVLQVGLNVVYDYTILDLNEGSLVNGVVQDMYLVVVAKNQPPIKLTLPPWITFDSSGKFFTVTITKNYQYENFQLLLIFENGIHKQILTFLCANSTLVYNRLKNEINTPSLQTIEILIKLKDPTSIKFIKLSFSGVFINYDQIAGNLMATGTVQSINAMLQELRFMHIIISNETNDFFSMKIIDNINYDLFLPNESISIFKRLSLSNSELKIYGTPQNTSEGNYSIEVIATDSFENVSRIISFQVLNDPPRLENELKKQIVSTSIEI